MQETVLEEHCITETIEQEQLQTICSHSLDMDPDPLKILKECGSSKRRRNPSTIKQE